jgi:hypothetical protein
MTDHPFKIYDFQRSADPVALASTAHGAYELFRAACDDAEMHKSESGQGTIVYLFERGHVQRTREI